VAKSLKIDFSGVSKDIKRGAGRVRVPEGDYVVKIIDHSLVKDNDTNRTKGIRWNTAIVSPEKYKGKKLSGFTSLKPEALWSLRNLIHAALGSNVAGKAVNFDPSKVYGKEVGAAVEDNEYTRDGKTVITSQVNTFFSKDEVQESEEDEDEDEEEDEEEEEEEEDDDLEEVEVEDL
jgi:TATA-binding protein-associated factor Taf7